MNWIHKHCCTLNYLDSSNVCWTTRTWGCRRRDNWEILLRNESSTASRSVLVSLSSCFFSNKNMEASWWVDFLKPLKIFHNKPTRWFQLVTGRIRNTGKTFNLPGPALAIWLVASYSRVTGFPGRTVENWDTVLLTVQYNLFKTSILNDAIHSSLQNMIYRRLERFKYYTSLRFVLVSKLSK